MNLKEKNNTKVLITGGDGQLGKCIKVLEINYPTLDLYFTNFKELDITDKENIALFFKNYSFDYVINCAAYTNVELSEKESERAFLVNAVGVKNLAEVCFLNKTVLIHISTDYVFDGEKGTPYTEEDIPNPMNEYGKSKLVGEQYLQKTLKKYFIVRTSWLYSEFGNNFFKTILKKSKNEKELTIVTSETGTPTNANDLAEFILNIIKSTSSKYGIYHFSNEGEATWYDFAYEILKSSGKLDSIKLEKADNYPTFAQRPKYSVLSKIKSVESFGLRILDWKDSLKKLYSKY
ncbi:dTDP-4-dehydrorhamnose reductase [Aquimarina sp. BL5]|uniref:dTDP-4-dehydrorhamnose reductase n=1 Tax=Aquimarina sp. BL5 TaxID=1714860 RepID=UPI000E4E5A16|nr:dTDP-4-dehydrorhamnose reductase [Aquimarina sp. BL5]AXT51981.1 dTDP-4-dehydrorhamnose reductase [Aquimarina sp. BL5]RKN03250.1 dTDP-4-dehydrorhamnose reductase [Aquimarina sp. BL5]